MYESDRARLVRVFTTMGIRLDPLEQDEEIRLPATALRRLVDQTGRQAHVHSAHRLTGMLRELLAGRPRDGHVTIRPGQVPQLTRLVEEWEREAARAEKLRRGIIPGALSGREVIDLYRRGFLRR